MSPQADRWRALAIDRETRGALHPVREADLRVPSRRLAIDRETRGALRRRLAWWQTLPLCLAIDREARGASKHGIGAFISEMIFDTSRFVTLFFVGASVAFFTICTIARSRTSGSLSLINGRQAPSLRISAAFAEHSSPPLHFVDIISSTSSN